MTDSRNESLDVLRGVAVISVMFAHYEYALWMGACAIGVELFFVLSGFLISGLLFSEIELHGTILLRRFWIRRGFKIYPAFYFFIGLTAFLFPQLRHYFGIEAVFLQNYFDPHITLWTHLWSLAVEEHFYFLLPMVLLLLHRWKHLDLIPALALVLALFCFALRWQYASRTQVVAIYQTHLRIDELFAGVMLRYVYDFKRAWIGKLSRWYLAPFAVALLIPAFVRPASALQVSLTLVSNMLAFTLLVLWAVPRRLRGVGWLSTIGTHSYSIYLWQMVVSMFFHAGPLSIIGLIAFIAISCAVGVAMSLMIEVPMLVLREKVVPSRRSRLASLTVPLDVPLVSSSPQSTQ